jgi:hypothetical protein
MLKPAPQLACALLSAVTLVGGAACGGDGNGGGGPSGQTSSFVGIVSVDDGSATGSLAVTIQSATLAPPATARASLLDPVNATGALTLGGTTALTGTYDPDTDILALTGGGFTFGGGFDGVDRLEGIWTGPGGTSGTFVTTSGSSGVAYCGTYTATDGSGDSGTFSIVITGGIVRGEAYSSTDQVPIPLDGTISGNTITIDNPLSANPLATGTRSGNTVSGTYDDGQGGTGTWTGSICQ